MAKATVYPAANRTAQNFSGRYPGVISSSLRAVVLHTTEGSGWPSYDGGASAPTFTALPDYTNKKLIFRQHFAVNESARALVNAAGGVNTNTTGVVQIELVGTSAKGGPGMYWPEAPDWALKSLMDFLQWLEAEWGVPIKSTVKWVAYPASYGVNASQRLSGSEWLAYKGILGHQHVTENDHGDPGLFPIARLLAFNVEGDWFDMADKADLKAAMVEVLKENPGLIGAAVHAQGLYRQKKDDGSAYTVADALLDAASGKATRSLFADAWVHNPIMATPQGTLTKDATTGRVNVSPLGMINQVFQKLLDLQVAQGNSAALVEAISASVAAKLTGGLTVEAGLTEAQVKDAAAQAVREVLGAVDGK